MTEIFSASPDVSLSDFESIGVVAIVLASPRDGVSGDDVRRRTLSRSARTLGILGDTGE
jgi:hypothetical protein